MKIVDRKTFLAMPADTVFSKYEPCVFQNIEIKGDTWGENDFVVQEISHPLDVSDSGEFIDACEAMLNEGASVGMDFYCAGRDGMFEENQLFAVWEQADINALIRRLTRCVDAS